MNFCHVVMMKFLHGIESQQTQIEQNEPFQKQTGGIKSKFTQDSQIQSIFCSLL